MATNVDFQLAHQQQFALEIMAFDTLNTSTVVEVRCLFCAHAHPPPQPVQTWHIFVPLLYQRHHETQHAQDWARYQACSPDEKNAFFGKNKTIAGQGANTSAAAATGSGDAVVVVKRGRGRPRKDAAPVAAVVVKEKKPRGRPRKDGVVLQWSDEMAQRLLQLRSETFANWFAAESRAMKLDGWKLVTSTLKDEFDVVVDTEQCKNKLRLLKLQSEKRSGANASSAIDSDAFVVSSSGTLDSAVNAMIGQATATSSASLAARQARRSSWPQPSVNEVGPVETTASTAAEKPAVGVATTADVPVKRGRGRPRRDSYPFARPNAPTSIALPPQKKQRVGLENVMSNGNALEARGSNQISGDTNTLLLQRILRATEEQKDALIAQQEATKLQTVSIQELLQFLKTRPGI